MSKFEKELKRLQTKPKDFTYDEAKNMPKAAIYDKSAFGIFSQSNCTNK